MRNSRARFSATITSSRSAGRNQTCSSWSDTSITEKLGPTEIEGVKFESIHTLARWYRITATIAPDGKAAVVWKLRKDR